MELLKQNILQLTLLDNEVDLFSSIIEKVKKSQSKIGFKKTYTQEEIELLNVITEYLTAANGKDNTSTS